MKNKIINLFLSFIIVFSSFYSCKNNSSGIPKPRTYPRVEFPKKKYKMFSPENCNFQFEIPVYSEIKNDKSYFNDTAPNNCWYNILYKNFNGNLYLTYYPITNKNEFDKLINDSFTLVSKHDIKASGRKEIKIHNQHDASGLLFKIEGDVASQTQFFITDTTSNFIRGSLYFRNKINNDSMQIIQDFIDKDILHLIETFSWK